MDKYSVLMTVYFREEPDYLRQSIESMLTQTVPPDDFVLVCDGALTQPLDAVIEAYIKRFPTLFQVIRLPENRGIGYANIMGINACKHDLVAKMDSDDIAKPCRCEKQLAAYAADPELAIVGAYISEFEGSPENSVCVRKVPSGHEEIYVYSKRRSPFNNQTVVYRKSAVLAVGGFADLRRCEDYDLFIRLLHAGYKGYNLPEVLVDYRLSSDAYVRRGNWNNLSAFIHVRWKAMRMGHASLVDIAVPIMGQVLLSALPTRLRAKFYVKFLR